MLATVKNNKEILGLINFKSNCRIFSDLAKIFPWSLQSVCLLFKVFHMCGCWYLNVVLVKVAQISLNISIWSHCV